MLLDSGYLAKEEAQIWNTQEEDFDFVKEYDFHKFDKTIRE